MVASSRVGTDNNARLNRIPSLRSTRWPINAMVRPDIAMPIVLALTARLMTAGVVP